MVRCAFCNYSDPVSLVVHIRDMHGLTLYLAIFPDLPILEKNLFAAVENKVYFRYTDDSQGLSELTEEEMEQILVSTRNVAPLRSEITQTLDF